MRDNTKPGFVYGLHCTCHSEGVRYVGISTSTRREDRIAAHRWASRQGRPYPVYNWMRKHGEDNITYSILQECMDRRELLLAEAEWIRKLGTRIPSPGGLNVTPGGDGGGGTVDGARKRAETMRAKDSNWGRGRGAPGFATGERNGKARLSAGLVSEFKSRLWDGQSQKTAAAELGIGRSNASSIARELTWSEIPWPTDRPRVVITTSEIRRAEAAEMRRGDNGRWIGVQLT